MVEKPVGYSKCGINYQFQVLYITPASGEYTITPEDGRVKPKHVDE
jgi:hypothetical protein